MQEPRHDWAAWIVVYSSRRTKLDKLAGRTPSASASSDTSDSSVDITGQKRPLDTNATANDDKRHPVEPANKRAREITPAAVQTSGAAAVTQTQSIARPIAKSADTPALVPARHYPSFNEVRGVTFDEATLMLFLESQPDTGPPSSAWDTLAKKVERNLSQVFLGVFRLLINILLLISFFVLAIHDHSILARMQRPGVRSISRSR